MARQGAFGMGAGSIGAAAAATVVAVAGWWGLSGKDEPAAVPLTSETVAAQPTPEPAVTPEPTAVLPPEAPRFDVVRVDGGGLATVAGSTVAGGLISLRVDGTEVAQATADAGGQFATIVSLALSDAPRVLGLVLLLPDGTEVPGVETVVLAPVVLAAMEAETAVAAPAAPETVAAEPAPEATAAAETAPKQQGTVATPVVKAPETAAAPVVPTAPAALLISPEGVQVLQPAVAADPPTTPAEVRIDSISYGSEDQVDVGGHATPEAAVRVYLDGAAVADTVADNTGRWKIRLAEVVPGLHSLRADQIDSAGKVLARFETPFKREEPQRLAAATPAPATVAATSTTTEPVADAAPTAAPAPVTITVQPGLTLWAIARETFGEGVMYVQVFEANRDKIKDPDLIYPGQVFTVPKP